jgi:hypothetical protein
MHWRVEWVRALSRDDYEVLLQMITEEQRAREQD